jgi:hypothetical protein
MCYSRLLCALVPLAPRSRIGVRRAPHIDEQRSVVRTTRVNIKQYNSQRYDCVATKYDKSVSARGVCGALAAAAQCGAAAAEAAQRISSAERCSAQPRHIERRQTTIAHTQRRRARGTYTRAVR